MAFTYTVSFSTTLEYLIFRLYITNRLQIKRHHNFTYSRQIIVTSTEISNKDIYERKYINKNCLLCSKITEENIIYNKKDI